MSEISDQNGLADPERFAGRNSAGGQPGGRRPARPRRGLRIALVSLASFVVLLGAVAVGGYAYVNHLAGSIQRIPVKFAKLAGATQPAGAMTVLLTGATNGPHQYGRTRQQRPDHAVAHQRRRQRGRRGVHPAPGPCPGAGSWPDAAQQRAGRWWRGRRCWCSRWSNSPTYRSTIMRGSTSPISQTWSMPSAASTLPCRRRPWPR